MTVLRREDVQSALASWDRLSVSHVITADPRNRASDPPPSSQSVTDAPPYLLCVSSSRVTPLAVPLPVRRRVGAPPRGSRPVRARSPRRFGCGRVVFGEPPKPATQALLRLVRNRHNPRGLAGAASGEHDADAGTMSIVPRRFDQQSADQRIPGPRDPAASMFLAGEILPGHEAEIRHQRAGRVAGRSRGRAYITATPEIRWPSRGTRGAAKLVVPVF